MRRQRRAALAAAVIPLLALGLAGCGTDDGNSAKSKPDSRAEEQERARQFAKCMRANGIDMPDPEVGEDGGIKIRMGGPGDKTPRKGTSDEGPMKAAMEKCRKYMPNGGEPVKLSPQEQEQQRRFAKCMREHGVDMPDPGADGRVTIRHRPGSKSVDPDSEEFKEAEKACEPLRPRPKAGN
jgi:hypothetical protein